MVSYKHREAMLGWTLACDACNECDACDACDVCNVCDVTKLSDMMLLPTRIPKVCRRAVNDMNCLILQVKCPQ